MRALIVEDNLHLSQSLQKILSQQGYQSHLSPSCESAIDFLKKNTINFIMLDILLPDKKGFEVLEMLSQHDQISCPKVLIMSGFVDESSLLKWIPNLFKDNFIFLKKPIDEDALLKILKDTKLTVTNNKKQPLFQTFFEKHYPDKPLNFYLPKDKTFDSKELIPALFITHLKKFTGQFKVMTDQTEKMLIDFYKGNIIKLISKSEQSFFGNLLIEYGFCLQEDIEALLKDKSSHQFLGEKLVEKKLLNPYMLQFILKEQIKIRLSEVIMSHLSLTLDILEKPSEKIQPADIDFNELDFIEWLADSLKTDLDKRFLKKFFLEIKPKPIYKISPINKALIHQKKFLQEYNLLFHDLQDGHTIEDLIKPANDINHMLLMLYFGLLTKSIFLRDIEEERIDLKKTEQLLDLILEQDSKNLFAVLDCPWEASPKEVHTKYQQLVLKIHPQALPPHTQQRIKKKCEQAFEKINRSYAILNNKEKRKEYLRIRKEEDLVEVMNKYEDGLTKIKQEQYQQGLSILEQISDHMHAPSNINLHILLAKLKSNNPEFSKPKALGKIKIAIDSCSVSLRTSALWWYIKGLYYVKIAQYEPAEELLKKSLKIEKNFILAKRDLLWLKQKVESSTPRKTNRLFNFFLKKSG